MRFSRALFPVLIIALHLLVLVLGVLTVEVHWDEGWNFCIARTVLEDHHYGCKIMGQLTDARLSTGWVSVLPAVVGFKLFGIGVWQGRIFAALISIGALFAITALARQLFGARVGWGALAVMLVVSGDYRIHPGLLGALSVAEFPMLLGIALGYLLILKSLRSGFWWCVPAALSFALALESKAQALPFLALALVCGTCSIFRSSSRRCGVVFLLTLFGAFWPARMVLDRSILFIIPRAEQIDVSGSGTVGIVKSLATVTDWGTRQAVLVFLTQNFSLFILSGVLVWGMIVSRMGVRWLCAQDGERSFVASSLLVLVTAWGAWFATLSIDFPRYFAPCALLGAIFIARLLSEFADDFQWRTSLSRAAKLLVSRRGSVVVAVMKRLSLVAIIIWTFVQVASNSILVARYLRSQQGKNESLVQTAEWLNSHLTREQVIESYDSQLFFLLSPRFHYPPDQLHLDVIRRSHGEEKVRLAYNPFEFSPDYIVVGPWSRDVFGLYQSPEIQSRLVRLEQFGDYAIYSARPTE